MQSLDTEGGGDTKKKLLGGVGGNGRSGGAGGTGGSGVLLCNTGTCAEDELVAQRCRAVMALCIAEKPLNTNECILAAELLYCFEEPL